MDPQIFITYSSKDQKVARTICTALENRGLNCWISVRNVRPGQNYQEQIVKAIRAAKVMVLVFTTNANNSSEIKKEIALASQNNLVVIPVRIEDVAPNEALTYEFATRQWIDLFDNWENAIGQLVDLIAGLLDEKNTAPATTAKPEPSPPPPPHSDTVSPMGFMGQIPGQASSQASPQAPPPTPVARKPLPRWFIPGGSAAAAVIVTAAIAFMVLRPSPPPPSPGPPTPQPIISNPTPPAPTPPRPSPAPSPQPATNGQSYGALAIALPSDVAKDGFSYGYVNDKPDVDSAESRALELCQTTKDAANNTNLRNLCKVIQDFSNKCVAVAMDPAAGTPGVGWSVAPTKSAAEQQAMNKCMSSAGPGRRAACVLSNSDCDGNAQ